MMSCASTSNTNNEKRRSAKTTRQQFQLFLDEMEIGKQNVAFRTNKYNPGEPDVLEKTWDRLTNKLNCVGGPCKTTIQWKKIFADWKCSVRKKARLLQSKQTGGGPPPDKPMTDLENKLLDFTGKVVVHGIPDIAEVGLDDEKENNQENNVENTAIEAGVLETPPPQKKRKQEHLTIPPKRTPTLTQSIKDLLAHNSTETMSFPTDV